MRLLPLLLLSACSATAIDEFEVCALEVALTPTAGAPGDLVVITGTPFTEIRDTRIEVGGVPATIELVRRVDLDACTEKACTSDEQCGGCGECGADGFCTGETPTFNCGLCETCRRDAGCAPCGACQGLTLEPTTRAQCFGDPLAGTPGACAQCRETMVFVVPSLPPGLTAVFVTNRNGQSEAVPFEVLPGPGGTGATGDTGAATGDTGTASTGDTGATVTGATGDTSEDTATTGGSG